MRTPFTGVGTALVTPFTRGGALDEAAVRRLARRQVDAGIHFLSPCGTTGENPTLTEIERLRIVEILADETGGKVPILAGAGGYNTAEVIHLAGEMQKRGASGLLSVTPYYNKPTQEGLYLHHRAIAEAVDLPQVLYNIPGRTAVNMTPHTVARLSKIRNIVGIKEGAGSLQQVCDIVHLCDERFTVLSGDDALTLPMLAVGAKGVVTVTANVAPADMAALIDAWDAGDVGKARQLHYKLYPLFQALFLETNPIPVKHAVALMGKAEAELRLPLCAMSQENLEKLTQVMKNLRLI
jgi:4-hydroxy-tetrahydrodipicolinate synthase